jgi:hypothetical protein
MKRHLGVVGAGLDAQVAIAGCRVELVMGELGQVGKRGRPKRRKPESIRPWAAKQACPKAERQRQPGGTQAERLTGVDRRAQRLADRVADRLAAGHRNGRSRPRLEQVHELGPVVGQDVEGRELDSLLGRRRDACLVDAVERLDLGLRTSRLDRPGKAEAARSTDREASPGGQAAGQQTPPADRRPADAAG